MSTPNDDRPGNGNEPDGATMRQIARELGAPAPAPAPWASVIARADGDHAISRVDLRATDTRRGLLVGLVAASLAALVVGLVALAQRGESDQLVPTAPSATSAPSPATTNPETTAAPDAGATPATAPPASGPVVATTAPSPPTTIPRESTVTTFTDEEVVELPPTPVSRISRLPAGAWVVATNQPEGYRPAYAVDEGLYRRTSYRDGDGNRIEINIIPQPFVGGEPIDVEGVTWLLQQAADGVLIFQREFAGSMIDVSFVGLDVDAARSVVDSLVAGSDSVLPVEPLRPSADYRDHDLLASDDDNPTTTIRGIGVDGWYCLETSGPTSSTSGCGDGRDGAISSEVRIDRNGVPDADGSITQTASSIVSSEVARVDVVFGDGTTTTAIPSDLSGKYEDRFWIATTRLASSDPFQDASSDFEVRLFDEYGSLLGLAPLPVYAR